MKFWRFMRAKAYSGAGICWQCGKMRPLGGGSGSCWDCDHKLTNETRKVLIAQSKGESGW